MPEILQRIGTEFMYILSCLCSGLYFVRPSVEGLAFMLRWHASSRHDTDGAWDQQAFNDVLTQKPPTLKYVAKI